ncbi:tRNA(Ile)-lysidine synthase [endosymbiont of Sipalinus gigas]|uniref:tRNA lysidine(34) synthetase TilS n=1 Tax=endosymbiont of Sipalinus gigas TaxID=1972134 RepID=UPI000DC73453|nr:tRNA lysidine(34) synthetase TilS [endosymbiont of Sipalinus gigas]BBA85192.1 tRNA(Ile)-lysidine synthase [endosymbiont of Sipalinus gigas]
MFIVIKRINEKLNYIINKFNIDTLLISFSGGMDSTLLLEIMIYIKNTINSNLNIKAIYINHKYFIKNSYILNHCIKYCNNKKIILYIKDILLKKKNNIEENLRKLRYKEISKIINKNEILLTGYNKNDQIENIFLSLKRGKGIKSILIRELTSIYNFKIFRPLINLSKLDILNYSKILNTSWIEDKSNKNLKFDRNFIRYKILNILNKRWPGFLNSSYKFLYICDLYENVLNIYIKKIINNLINKKDKSINIFLLNIKNINLTKIIIRIWLEKYHNLYISYYDLIRIYNDIILNDNPLSTLKIKNIILNKYNNTIYCIKNLNNNLKYYKNIYIEKINKFIKLPYNSGIIKISDNFNLIKNYIDNYNFLFHRIRKINNKEIIIIKFNNKNFFNSKIKYKIIGFNNKKTLKEIYSIFDIPICKRNKIPMLFFNDKLISLIGYFITYEGISRNIDNEWFLIYKIKNL